MLNKLILIGRLAHDPELRGTAQTAVCSFVVAAENRGSNVQFLRCKCFNQQAQLVFQHCKKGSTVSVEGHIEYKDLKFDLIADNVQFLSSNNNEKEII